MKRAIKTKFLTIMLILTIIPLMIFGYLAINKSRDFGLYAADRISKVIKKEAETNMQSLVIHEAEEIDKFFVEVKNDLKGFAKNINIVHNTPSLRNIEYTGESFAYWATTDWVNHTNKEKINGILDGSIKDHAYDKLVGLLNETQVAKLREVLMTLAGDYEVITPENMGDKPEFFPRFIISKDFFFSLQEVIGEPVEKSDKPFALVNLMFGLLNEESQSRLNKGMNMLHYGISTVDNHETYRNLRMGYWGNTKEGIEFVYAGDSSAYHPATNGVGNCYYCKSPFALRKSAKADAVWLTELLDPLDKVSMAIYPVFEAFDDTSTPMIGFVEYWIDWATLSDKVVNVRIGETGYMFMIDETKKIISHPVAEKLGTNFTEGGNSILDDTTSKMIASEQDLITLTFEGRIVYLVYAPIKETGWSVGLTVPVEEIVKPAEEMRSYMIIQTERLNTQNTIFAIILIIIVIIFGLIFSKSITKPITKLRDAAIEIGKGKLDTKIDVKSKDEIGELASSFNQMTRDLKQSRAKIEEYSKNLEKLLNQKDDFINQLGHDLKSPLTPLVNLLPIIENTEKDPKSKEIIEILNRNVGYMKNLVVKTIKLAKLNAPSTKFDLKDINLWEEAENNIKDQQLICGEKDFTVENKVDENIFVKADKLQLREVFDNLISNAVKYSPHGSTITIDAHDDGDFVTVSIMDSGKGLTSEQINHIFDEFYKTDESRHDFASSGLGLSICKRIVGKHGGRIWAESSGLRKGSTFYFTIPKSSSINIENVSEKIDMVLKNIKKEKGER